MTGIDYLSLIALTAHSTFPFTSSTGSPHPCTSPVERMMYCIPSLYLSPPYPPFLSVCLPTFLPPFPPTYIRPLPLPNRATRAYHRTLPNNNPCPDPPSCTLSPLVSSSLLSSFLRPSSLTWPSPLPSSSHFTSPHNTSYSHSPLHQSPLSLMTVTWTARASRRGL